MTLTWHPERTTELSSGRRVVPHVWTSVALELDTSRVNTKLKSSALLQLDVDAKLTFRVVFSGSTGRAEDASRACTKVVVSSA